MVAFCTENPCQKSKIAWIFNAKKRKKIIINIAQKWEYVQFWKLSKFFKTSPNRLLMSEKNSYRVWEPESKKWETFIKTLFLYGKYSCDMSFFGRFQKGKKSHFGRYLFKDRSYGPVHTWKKNLWPFNNSTSNITGIEPLLRKI